MTKTIQVSDSTWQTLSRKKIDMKAESLEEVIQHLLNESLERELKAKKK